MAAARLRTRSAIGRQETESLAVQRAHGPEVPLVEGQDVTRVVTGGQDHDRGVGQPDAEIGLTCGDVAGRRHVDRAEGLEAVGAPRDLVE